MVPTTNVIREENQDDFVHRIRVGHLESEQPPSSPKPSLFPHGRGYLVKRLYIAGAYSADNVLGVLDNIRRGMRAGTQALLAGFAPFVPWFDFHFQLMLRENEALTVEDYYRYSLAWLEVSDAVWVLPGSENSKGTQAEIKRAQELGIPVHYERPF